MADPSVVHEIEALLRVLKITCNVVDFGFFVHQMRRQFAECFHEALTFLSSSVILRMSRKSSRTSVPQRLQNPAIACVVEREGNAMPDQRFYSSFFTVSLYSASLDDISYLRP